MTVQRIVPDGTLLAGARSPAQPMSLYERVGAQLGALIPLFGVESMRATIERAYHLLCNESLAIPAGRRPWPPSRLNADGTPFQFALELGASRPSLQFLTESGPPRALGGERLANVRERLCDLAVLAGAEESLSLVFPWLDELAPAGDVGLLGDAAGAIWIGATFGPDPNPRIKAYVNAKWGPQAARWSRLALVADHLGAGAGWGRIQALVRDELEPLGVSLAFGPGKPPVGRMYVSGYGCAFGFYEALAAECVGKPFREYLRSYGTTMLHQDYLYPSRSVVCSFGLESGARPDFKFELCGHCAFDTDVQANKRCIDWLREAGVYSAPYVRMVDHLSGGVLSGTEARLHAYLGIGTRKGQPYSTFYFNPAAGTV